MKGSESVQIRQALAKIKEQIDNLSFIVAYMEEIPTSHNSASMQVEPDCMKCRCDGHCSVSLKSPRCHHMFRFNQHA